MGLLTIERVAALRRTPLFAGVPDHVLAGLARIAEEVRVDAGDTVITQGDEDDSMFVIAHGRVRVHVGMRTVVELEPGASVGELSLLAPEPRSASVTAVTPGVLLRVRGPAFDELMVDHPELARSAIRMLVTMVRDRTAAGAGDPIDVATAADG
jgi:CRP/FNR family transcriptional regulator, cyclic AMP receptor protein